MESLCSYTVLPTHDLFFLLPRNLSSWHSPRCSSSLPQMPSCCRTQSYPLCLSQAARRGALCLRRTGLPAWDGAARTFTRSSGRRGAFLSSSLCSSPESPRPEGRWAYQLQSTGRSAHTHVHTRTHTRTAQASGMQEVTTTGCLGEGKGNGLGHIWLQSELTHLSLVIGLRMWSPCKPMCKKRGGPGGLSLQTVNKDRLKHRAPGSQGDPKSLQMRRVPACVRWSPQPCFRCQGLLSRFQVCIFVQLKTLRSLFQRFSAYISHASVYRIYAKCNIFSPSLTVCRTCN